MPYDIEAPVVRNTDLGNGNWLLELQAPAIASTITAGQFVMLGVPGADILLRRPFSVCGARGTLGDGAPGALQILYRIVGRGTALMASMGSGAHLQVLGPLGRGFSAPEPRSLPLFVAGGIGSAPFPQLAAELGADVPAPWMIYGARTARDLPLLSWFRERCARVEVTTEDGSLGSAGRVTEPLEELLASAPPEGLTLYACGPNAMLAAVTRLADLYEVACQLSLEAPMACGFGVCLGCVVRTHGAGGELRYERVCVEGPVMEARRLAW